MKITKKLLCLVLTFCLTISLFVFEGIASEADVFNITKTVIVKAENASITENYAAERLKFYLDKITGGDISIITDKENAEYEISVGATNRSTFDFGSSPDGSYKIVSDTERIIIDGAGSKGTINGVYYFLETYCDCHWYETEVIIIPENASLIVPADINVDYTPFFEYSESDTNSSRDPEFAVANGVTGGIYKKLAPEQGYTVDYIGGASHTLINTFCKPSDYFESNPEYFALVDGERVPDQLCLTNEDVINVVTEESLAILEEKFNPDAPLQILSITQNDNDKYCTCDSCKALDKENGSQSGTMITFANTVAEKIKATGKYESLAIDTFAYQYTRKAPSNVKPREDVIVRLCSIECCFGHTLDDASCKENVKFMKDLKEWSTICNRLYIWNYNLNCDESVNIYANFGTLQRNTQVFYEHNVKGIYQQGIFYIAECDAEFSEMKTYLLAKLMQNPYLDMEKEMNDYLLGVYGPGGKYLKEFIDIVTKRAVTKSKHLYLEQDSRYSLPGITAKEVKRCDELWEMAKAEAENEEQLQQILRSELCWRYWKCSNKRSEFSRFQHPYLWLKANKDLYNDFVKMGVKRLGERKGHDLSSNDLRHFTRRIYTWITLYDEPIWDAINPYALKLYDFLERSYIFFHSTPYSE